jgi:hypothetical protein
MGLYHVLQRLRLSMEIMLLIVTPEVRALNRCPAVPSR